MSRSRTTAADLARFLDDGSTPVYLLDEDRRIVFCNDACADWVGLHADELLGQQCNYHPPDEPTGAAAAAAGLCPPPKVFSGHAQLASVSCTRPDGRLVYRRGHFLPLGEGQDESAPVIAILEAADCPPDARPDDVRGETHLHDQVRRFRHEMQARYTAESLIGNNPQIQRARTQIELAARTTSGVLIVGPRGSGKDHAAKAIHFSQREPGPLVPLACTVLETNLLRSTLRALRPKGNARLSAPGTLLLNDADEMPAEAQEDLIEMLADGSLAMRVIATATRPLGELVAEGAFYQSLACSLSTLVVEMPALARRLDDLPLLAQALLEEVNATSTRQVAGFTSEALDLLAAYPWPGNVDELAAVVRDAHEAAQRGEVTAPDLPKQIHWSVDAAGHATRSDESIVLVEFLARVERELIARAMRRAKGNKSRAAKLLGLTRPRLYRRLVQLGLEQPEQHGLEPKH
jgi:DNA-binding NtrC family response regulator